MSQWRAMHLRCLLQLHYYCDHFKHVNLRANNVDCIGSYCKKHTLFADGNRKQLK